MARDERVFTDEEIAEKLERIKRPTFYGELTLQSKGGKITDANVHETFKPRGTPAPR